MSTPSETDRPKYRFQFGLKSLLLLTFVCAVACAWWVRPRWSEELVANGALRIVKQVRYDDQQVAQRHGTWTAFDAQGRPRVEGAYLEPLAAGHWVFRDTRGQPLLEGDCHRGQKEGLWIAWYAADRKKSQTMYEQDLPHGESSSWWPNGHLRSRGACQAGRRTGMWSFHDERGTLRSQGEYLDGQEQGTWQAWDERGQALASRHFAGGRECTLDPRALQQYAQDIAAEPYQPAAQAVWAAYWLAPNDVQLLIAGLQHPHPNIRSRAALFLTWRGPAAAAIPQLIRTLDDSDAGVRLAAARALGRQGPAAAAALPKLQTLADRAQENQSPAVAWRTSQAALLSAMVQIAPTDLALMRDLFAALPSDLNLGVRFREWSEHPAMIPGLIKLTADRSPHVATQATLALGLYKQQSSQVLPTLLTALDHPRPGQRMAGCRALRMLGPQARPALPRLEQLVRDDPDPNVQQIAHPAAVAVEQTREGQDRESYGIGSGGFF